MTTLRKISGEDLIILFKIDSEIRTISNNFDKKIETADICCDKLLAIGKEFLAIKKKYKNKDGEIPAEIETIQKQYEALDRALANKADDALITAIKNLDLSEHKSPESLSVPTIIEYQSNIDVDAPKLPARSLSGPELTTSSDEPQQTPLTSTASLTRAFSGDLLLESKQKMNNKGQDSFNFDLTLEFNIGSINTPARSFPIARKTPNQNNGHSGKYFNPARRQERPLPQGAPRQFIKNQPLAVKK